MTPKYVRISINCDSTFQMNSVYKHLIEDKIKKLSKIRPLCDLGVSDIYYSLVCVPDSSTCTTSRSTLIIIASMGNTAGLHLSSHGSLSRYFGLSLNNPYEMKLYGCCFFNSKCSLCEYF